MKQKEIRRQKEKSIYDRILLADNSSFLFFQLCEFVRFNTRDASGEPLVVIEPTTATILLTIEQRILGD
jgi:hypothetical protein